MERSEKKDMLKESELIKSWPEGMPSESQENPQEKERIEEKQVELEDKLEAVVDHDPSPTLLIADSAEKSEELVEKAEELIEKSEESVEEPEELVERAEASVEKPEELIEKAEASVEKPEKLIEKAEESVEEPEELIQKPQEKAEVQEGKGEKKQSNKVLYQRAIDIAWPSVVESVFFALAGMIDTYMVSGLGPAAVAAVGLTTQPKFFFLSPFIALAVALSALVARRKGEGNMREANEVLTTAMAMNMVLSAIISLVCVIWAGDIIHLAGSNAETHDMAEQYFAIVMGGSVFGNIDLFINSSQRGTGNTRLSLYSNLASSGTNVLFNYMLINGHFGFPALGVRGAAIATVIGTVVGSLISFASLFHHSSYLRMSYIRRKKLKPTRRVMSMINHLSITYLVENILMRIGFIVTAWKAAKLGTDPFAAHQVGMNILNMGFSLAAGMEAAAVTLVGQSLGAEKKQRAKRYGNVCQRIGWICDAVFVFILLLKGRALYQAHFTDPSIVDMGVMIVRYVMVIAFLQMVQVVYAGCLRAAGDIQYTLIADTVSVTVIRSLSTILFVDFFHLGLRGIWLGILMDQTSRVLFMKTRYDKGKWVDIKI